MALSGTLGTILQGVSQQQPRVRLLGQVAEQFNLHSDVVAGLTSRPATKEITTFTGKGSGLNFDDVEIAGIKYTVGYKDGALHVWGADGTEFTVETQDADAISYLGDNMSFHVYDESIYVSNQDVVVLEDATIDMSSTLREQGLIQALGGSFGRDLSITILYSDGTERYVQLNVPDTDPDEVNAGHIMDNLLTLLNGSGVHQNIRSGTLKGTTTLTREDSVLLVTDTAFTFVITVTDGDDGKVLRQHTNTAKKVEDLVQFAPHGTLVKVEGEETSDDDFWMRFEVEDVTTVGNGFGTSGLWREAVDTSQPVSLDLKTMPHILFKIGNTFYFQRNLWQERRVGDADTNPHPSFLGEKITDLGGFQSRLTFTAGANWIAGRTNIPSDYYLKSVTSSSDTDPIDISSTTESEVALRWMVPFDRDLLLMSEKHQFIVSGRTALTPNNAGMVLTTDFEMSGIARPSSTGRTILFPYTVGEHAGLKEFFSSDEIATNGADNVTETLTKYIEGQIRLISTSTNFNTSLILSDDPGSQSTVWVYKYLWEGIEKKQSSMSKWIFPLDVAYVYWDNAVINVIMRDGIDYVLATMDMDFADHAVGYRVSLDRQTDEVVDGSSEVTLSYANAEFVQHTGCSNPGSPAVATGVTGSGPYVYTFNVTTVPSGATVVAGLRFIASVNPTMPFLRDREGRAISSHKLMVTDMIAFYDRSGAIKSTIRSKYRSVDGVFSNDKIITVGDPDDVAQIGIRSGEFRIPWGESPEWSDLTLESFGLRPMTLLEIEWKGQLFKRGKRV